MQEKQRKNVAAQELSARFRLDKDDARHLINGSKILIETDGNGIKKRVLGVRV